MSIPSPSLPPELWLEVFQCQYISANDLSNICLIAHRWNQLAAPILYQNIYLSGDKDQSNCESSVTIAKIKSSPVLAKSVKTCRLSHWELGPEYTSLLNLLPFLPNLHTLNCVRVFVGDPLCQCISQHQTLCSLEFEQCNLHCSTPQPPPPKLISLVIGPFSRLRDCAPLVSFSLSPTLRTLSIWQTSLLLSTPEWKKETKHTVLTDLRVSTFTPFMDIQASIRDLISRSPLLKRLVLFSESEQFEIPSGTAPQLESFTSSRLSSLLTIVPDRPIRDVSFVLPCNKSPDLAFASILRSTAPLRQLKIETTAKHLNQQVLYQIVSLFPHLQYLTIETKYQDFHSILELLDDATRRKLSTLHELRSLCLPCFNHPPSQSMLARELDFIKEFSQAMLGLVEVSFSKLCRWDWVEGRWKSSGDGLLATPFITAFVNSNAALRGGRRSRFGV